MKAKIEDVVTQVKEHLDLEATYMENNHAILIKKDGWAHTAFVFWFATPEPGIFNTDELEASASIIEEDNRLHTHGIEEFDVETMEEFLSKLKEVLKI